MKHLIIIAAILMMGSLNCFAEPWIHNNNGSEKFYVGNTFPVGSFIEITPADWVAYAEDDDLLTDIQSGDVFFSKDGSTDLSTSESVTMYHSLVIPESQHFTWPTFIARNVRDAIIEAKETPAPLIYEYEESESESSTTSNSFQLKLRMTKNVIAGEYRVSWSFEVGVSSNNKKIEYRVELDDSSVLAQPMLEPRTAEWTAQSGFKTVTLSAGQHTFDIEYRDASNKAAKIRRARIDFLKVD